MIANPLSWFQIQYNVDFCERGFRNILSIMRDNQHWSRDFGCPPHCFLLVTGIRQYSYLKFSDDNIFSGNDDVMLKCGYIDNRGDKNIH